jgi:AmmeMemoRadiSam system protein B
VSPGELPYLDLDVWLLFNPQRLRERGEARAAAVITGGKHGLLISHGQQRGILLPGVAADHGWDARTFLEQVCVKAGLHPSRWKDDETTIATFEGYNIGGPAAAAPEGAAAAAAPFLSPAQLRAYADFCRDNLAAMLRGAAPRYSFDGAPDGHVSGAVLRVGDGADPLQVSQVSLRPAVALQATLFRLAQAAASALLGRGLDALPDGLPVGLTVLYDPAMHGTVRDADLRGLEPRRRAVLVTERARSGLVFDPAQPAAEVLGAAAAAARVGASAAAPVFSLEADSTDARLTLANGPRPAAGVAVRPPAVAGSFYPGDAAGLARMVHGLLSGERCPEPWPAAMVPHAGLAFSGRVAAAVLRRLVIPDTVIVIGPKHTPHGMEWAVAPHLRWSLPGLTVASDPALARELADAVPGLELDAAAHQHEHGIEVELPLLAQLAPRVKVVGVTVGGGTLADCRRFAEGLAAVVRARADRPLLLISSDMNHFANDAETRRLDGLALAALERMDPKEVYEVVKNHHISMCGVLPAVIVLEALRRLGALGQAERVAYATSADATGDRSRVVGYAGMLFG